MGKYKLYEDIPLLTYICLKILRWTGHIKMEESRIPRKALEAHFGGKKIIGRPWVEWVKMVKGNARDLLDV